jgi:uncharacterized oxidoreductase
LRELPNIDTNNKDKEENMNIKGNTILITGGATGIGFALAQTLLKAGNQVIICGRREVKLKEAKQKLPQIQIRVCDVAKEKERAALFNWVKEKYPGLNILINNAGIQKMIDLKKGRTDLVKGENEIETNLVAPIRLSAYFIPWFLQQHDKETAIINVSSGLGFVPIAVMPVYCASKAALHSYTFSLRYQLKDTSVKVFEIIPPAVDTDLGKSSPDEESDYKGIPPSEVAEAVLKAIEKNQYEIAVGESKGLVATVGADFQQAFENMNRW